MMKEKETLEIIESDVREQVNLVIDQINYEVKNMEEDQINFFKEGLKKEIETYKEKELNELRLFAATQASQNKLKTKRDLLHLRTQLVDQLFDDVKNKLTAFVESADYTKFIEKKIEQLGEIDHDGYFEVRKEDVSLLTEILKKKNCQCKVEETLIQLGGFRYVNPNKGFEIDNTLDFSLQNEMTWFQNNSGFTI
ncbi:V-type ATP synthase subunit E [Anaerorhabdus furcosa]|uniref:H+-ATPase subunit E/Vma4 n=1 Tax=Anaerorhabdus furcosa TaxID=118967 RepID=A0A1T4PTZ0_9FIRM|nr:V-type ATP synthase subunit E family protein [Anaerorhabdus furcosa]SJZ94388.1 H+-ATPase subunit E/Vma4 [Anaerorhabdus furcosa]